MNVLMQILKCVLLLMLCMCTAASVDLGHSDITIVNDRTRFTSLHPGVSLDPFKKAHHVKGNYVFTAGERITGDRLILTFLDETQFTKAEDIEVYLTYPSIGHNGAVITAVEVYVDLSSEDADAFFSDGGIEQSYAQILLACNRTLYYTYEIYIYGY